MGTGAEGAAEGPTEGEDATDVLGESAGSLDSGVSSDTGVVPHRPRTQPPTRRPKFVALRGPVAAVEVVLVLSEETIDAASDLVFAAIEASNDWDVCAELVARSVWMAGADIIGGVETNSTLGGRMRWGIFMPGCQLPIRAWRLLGVWMSMPATDTDSKLSWEEDLRIAEG